MRPAQSRRGSRLSTIARLLKRKLGASRVVIYDTTFRSGVYSNQHRFDHTTRRRTPIKDTVEDEPGTMITLPVHLLRLTLYVKLSVSQSSGVSQSCTDFNRRLEASKVWLC